MELKQIGAIMAVLVVVLVGGALTQEVANDMHSAVNTQTNSNESVLITELRGNSTGGYPPRDFNETKSVEMLLADDDVASINQVRWGNGTVLTSGTDYVAAGYSTTSTENITITLYNTTKNVINGQTQNYTYVDYTYNPDTYVDDGTSRTLLSVFLPLFFILAIVLMVLGIVYKEQLKDMLRNIR